MTSPDRLTDAERADLAYCRSHPPVNTESLLPPLFAIIERLRKPIPLTAEARRAAISAYFATIDAGYESPAGVIDALHSVTDLEGIRVFCDGE